MGDFLFVRKAYSINWNGINHHCGTAHVETGGELWTNVYLLVNTCNIYNTHTQVRSSTNAPHTEAHFQNAQSPHKHENKQTKLAVSSRVRAHQTCATTATTTTNSVIFSAKNMWCFTGAQANREVSTRHSPAGRPAGVLLGTQPTTHHRIGTRVKVWACRAPLRETLRQSMSSCMLHHTVCVCVYKCLFWNIRTKRGCVLIWLRDECIVRIDALRYTRIHRSEIVSQKTGMNATQRLAVSFISKLVWVFSNIVAHIDIPRCHSTTAKIRP